MADYTSIAAAAESLERLLKLRFQEEEPVPGKSTRPVLVRTEDLKARLWVVPALVIYLYRVDFNKTMRAAWSAVGSQDGRSHLPLDLHFLLTPYADDPSHELNILGRTMQCLEGTPILGGPLLAPQSQWTPHEVVQVSMEEISTEDVMRTFDSLPVDYKLSVPYVARIVRIDGRVDLEEPPVTTVVAGAKPEAEL